MQAKIKGNAFRPLEAALMKQLLNKYQKQEDDNSNKE